MSNLIEQKIENGNGNTNIAQQTVNNGVSIEKAMQICFELFKNNFPTLQKEARETAERYMQDNGKDIMTNIINDKNVDFNKFNRPDCQNILCKVLVHQACYNEKDKNKILSDLLISKLKNDIDANKFFDIILDKCIVISTQLTLEHIDLLSLIYLSQNVILNGKKFTNFSFVEYFNNVSTVFGAEKVLNQYNIAYLISQNCLRLDLSQYPEEFANRYNLDLQYLKENLSKNFSHIPEYRVSPIAIPVAILNINNKLNENFGYEVLI